MVRKLITLSIVFYLILGTIGLILRIKITTNILPFFQYENLLQAHSHMAFLGWVYLALAGCTVHFMFRKQGIEHPSTRWTLRLTVLLLFSMLVSFSLQGYGLFSIIFSSLFIFFSYAFALLYFRFRKREASLHMIRPFFTTGILLMMLSSLGPWTLAFAKATGIGGDALSNAALYFYLNFQYNGWFTFLLIGSTYAYLSSKGILPTKWIRTQWWTLVIGVFPAYIPSILWLNLPIWLEIVGVIGVSITLVSTVQFLWIVYRPMTGIIRNRWILFLFQFSILAFLAKGLFELLGAFPILAEMVYSNRNVIIGFLHLTLLAFVTGYLFFIIMQFFPTDERFIPWISMLFIPGAFFIVFLLFLMGLLQWLRIPFDYPLYNQWLAVASVLTLLGGFPLYLSAKGWRK